MKEQIARKEAEITREKKEVAYWHQYKDRGCHSHGKQIKLLQDELVDMQKSFDEMAGEELLILYMYIDDIAQDCGNSMELAIELLYSSAESSIW